MKRILLAVTGGIACYKSADIARELMRQGFEVSVIMTDTAKKFVSPLLFQTLTRHPVRSELFEAGEEDRISHIQLAQEFDCILVAPSTANMISRHALGIGDDLVSTVLLAASVPVIHAPAMNGFMLENPAVKRNIAFLSECGTHFIPTGFGELACGTVSYGRMAEVDDVVAYVRKVLDDINNKATNSFSNPQPGTEETKTAAKLQDTEQPLAGKKVLITAGPTREHMDPFRFMSNPSSGKMGFSLAAAATKLGAETVLISGPVNLDTPNVDKRIDVITAREMFEATRKEFANADVVIMSAAISDYRFKTTHEQKVKKDNDDLTIVLEKNKDILAFLGKEKREGQFIVGFSAETENREENALRKLKSKKADLIVANDISNGSGFGINVTGSVWVLDGKSSVQISGDKPQIAESLIRHILPKLPTTHKTGNS